MTYPFEPKSTSRLEAGQFWAIRLSNGTYGAAVVISPGTRDDGARDTRLFIAGLLDWNGPAIPTAKELEGAQVARMGVAHVRSIQRTGGSVLGTASFRSDPPTTTNVFRFMPVWGFGYAEVMAERRFVSGQPWESEMTSLGKLPQVAVQNEY